MKRYSPQDIDAADNDRLDVELADWNISGLSGSVRNQPLPSMPVKPPTDGRKWSDHKGHHGWNPGTALREDER